MIGLLKRAIDLDPSLNAEERNLLSVSYKYVITDRRSAIRVLTSMLDQEETKVSQVRIDHVRKFRTAIIGELDGYALELINLVDSTLLPAATTADSKLFFEKLKADYWRYIAENKEGDERVETANNATNAYEKAMEIAKQEIPEYKPAVLGLVLNYSVCLYEIVGKRDEAIELAKKTFTECENTVNNNTPKTYEEAANILQLLQDNVALWTTHKE
jgi:14-3-3 protein epsilon